MGKYERLLADSQNDRSRSDIVEICNGARAYNLYLNVPYYYGVNEFCGYDEAKQISSASLKRKIENLEAMGYTKKEHYNLADYDPDKWELFYTENEHNDELVDQIEIDQKGKTYKLLINAPDLVTDGYDEYFRYIESSYVSKEVFNIIVNGIKLAGFKGKICDNFENTRWE